MKAIPTSAEEAAPPLAAEAAWPFDRVYAEHFAFVWRCLRSLGVPDGAVDDAAQDVFLVVYRQLPAFRAESSIKTWLFGILRNVASNHRRRAHRKSLRQDPLRRDVAHAAPSPLDNAQDAEAAAFLRSFLEGLDERKRDVFVLGALEQLSMPEVAAALSIPLNTAYTRLRRTREAFRRALTEHRGQP